MAKYGNKKVIIDGMTFDSRKEYNRWKELKLLESAGVIRQLERQVVFGLIPAQYEHGGDHTRNKGKCIERAVNYKADFTYQLIKPVKGDEKYMTPAGWVVEDVKGVRTKEYILKRKMLLYIHGIRIKEI